MKGDKAKKGEGREGPKKSTKPVPEKKEEKCICEICTCGWVSLSLSYNTPVAVTSIWFVKMCFPKSLAVSCLKALILQETLKQDYSKWYLMTQCFSSVMFHSKVTQLKIGWFCTFCKSYNKAKLLWKKTVLPIYVSTTVCGDRKPECLVHSYYIMHHECCFHFRTPSCADRTGNKLPH